MNNWWNESYFELPDKDHVHFHICTEYFCWLWKAIYLFNYKYFFIHTDVAAQFLLCFSLIQNTNRILSTKVPPGAITSINGMRVLSMWWVILGHCYYFMQFLRPSKLFHIFITKVFPKIYFRRRNNSSKPTTVSEHFLSHSNHSHTDMQLIPLEKIHSSRDSVRKARESHLIDKAMTLEPHGLNRRDELL